MSNADCCEKEECRDSTKTNKEKVPRSGGILKHIILGSLIAVILGGVSKYCLFDKLRLSDEKLPNLPVKSSEIAGSVNVEIIEHEVSTLGTFGEEEQVEFHPNDNNVTIEQIPQESSPEDQDEELIQSSEDELLNEEAEGYHYEFDENESEDSEGEPQMDSEALKRMLKEDVHIELDEGFATKESENEESVDVNDDADAYEYEHEADDDITDNNWSDDEVELKKMEEDQQQ
ncbi:putative transmembrane domain-containing protein [Cryptosporidium canis]|uniref:Transmembrane domain-containing protein n=1 Tax=Cryptosporidium canis TaxID=195482 RepID=A0ABQ8PAZ6_9CRYT|nr:putative transmembrane domain-containing protein [Cryptosporidium canis]